MAQKPYRVRASDPKGIQKKLLSDALYGPGLRSIVEWGVGAMTREARKRAPGTLAGVVVGEIKHTKSSGGFGVLTGRTVVRQRTNKGFRYPQALNYSKKIKGTTKRYRYRSGPKAGKLTKGWFSSARGTVTRELKKRTEALADGIKAGWVGG